jgi:hypothetical protein
LTVITHDTHLAVWVYGQMKPELKRKKGDDPIRLRGEEEADLMFRNIRLAELPEK